MIKKRIGWIVLLLGCVLLIMGFIFEMILAGIPYQDPTPALTQKYLNYVLVAYTLYKAGIPIASLGLIIIIVLKLKKHKPNRKKEPSEDDILNKAMDLCLEFGENWRKPVDVRLQKLYPDISQDKAKEIDVFIRKTRDEIHEMIEQFYLSKMPNEEMKKRMKDKFPFLNNKNLGHLHSQGIYYAWKDNG